MASGNPISFVEVDGHLPQAIIGGLIGGGIDLDAQLLSNGRDVDWKSVHISAHAGAFTGGLSTVVSHACLSAPGRVGVSMAGNAGVNAGATALNNLAQGRSMGAGVGRSAAIGVAGSVVRAATKGGGATSNSTALGIRHGDDATGRGSFFVYGGVCFSNMVVYQLELHMVHEGR